MMISRIPGQPRGRGTRKHKSAAQIRADLKKNFNDGGKSHQQPDLVVVFQDRKFMLSGLWLRCAITGTRLGCRNLVEISVKRTGQDGEVLWVSPAGIAQAKLSGYSSPAEIFKYIQEMS